MREIKYRQEVKERFVSGYGSRFHYWGYIGDDENGISFQSPLGINQGGESYQFTGLTDKNGVDIYEGDIINYSNIEGHHTIFSSNYVVEFGEQDLGHSSYQKTIGWNATRVNEYRKPSKIDSGRMSNGILDLFGYHKAEIIGNIHETPEVLRDN